MKSSDLIFLVGMPGTGKTALAKRLAPKLGRDFFDMDKVIEEQEERTITKIFEEEGEEYFRKKEQEVLIQMFEKKNSFIATGGGAPCFFDNMDQMLKKGLVVFINTDPAALAERIIEKQGKRPHFAGMTYEEVYTDLKTRVDSRIPFYSKADIILEPDKETNVEEVVEMLDNALKPFLSTTSK